MSFEQRAPLAAALSTAPGVKGYAYMPRAPKVGDAWLKWEGLTQVSPGTVETNWTVIVLVPLDDSGQGVWIDQNLDGIIEALMPLAWVDGVITGSVNDSPALMINCRE